MDLANYTVKDFVLNESFQRWIIDPDEETKSFWEAFQMERYEMNEMIMEAKRILQNMILLLDNDLNDDCELIWMKISNDING